jgi:hypothetical protein
MIRRAAAALSALAFAACAATEAETPAEEAPPARADVSGDCQAGHFAMLVGQPGGEIDTATLPHPHRVYGYADMVTMDHRPERLNIVIGPDDRVQSVRCG